MHEHSDGTQHISSQAFDLVIVGGGMVGATLAASVAQRFGSNVRVAVIEREKVGQSPSTFDLRSIVLSRSTVRFLHQQGWWSNIVSDTTPIKTVAVERAGQFGRVDFTAKEASVPALGYVIGNDDLGSHLWREVCQQPNISVFDNCVAQNATPHAAGWSVQLMFQVSAQAAVQQQAQSINAKLLVVADGASSETLKALGVTCDRQPYGQHALVAGLGGVQWDQRIALERFLPGGESIAVLPRGDRAVGVVMAAAPETIARFKAFSDQALLDEIAQRLGQPVARLGHCLERGCYPLVAATAQEIVRRNLLVVGNAAQSLHPIAGQGFNLAVRDLATFLRVLSSCVSRRERGEQLGASLVPLDALQTYANARAGDRRRIRQFCHQLLGAFAWEQPGLVAVRQLGMALFDTLPATKAWLAHSTLAPRVGPQPPWTLAEGAPIEQGMV